jgi:hypothetical protein
MKAADTGMTVVPAQTHDVSCHRSVDTQPGCVRDAEIFRDQAGMGLL